jgi:glucose/arabinose dehydrogenase
MHATGSVPARNPFFIALAFVPLLLVACGGGGEMAQPANPEVISLRLQRIDSSALVFSFPVLLTAPPGDTTRLFVVEKTGRIKIVNKSTNALVGTFLDISGIVSTGSEQGLLGLAFDPLYATNRRFYVSYTDVSGDSVIARYLVSTGNANVAVGTVDRVILTLPQPDTNHNGGMIVFGPDQKLYIGFGDGGGAGDPNGHAQNPADLLGKLLRIDVSQGNSAQPPYLVPLDNPFPSATPGKEVWSLGLRNPWRYSFDRQTGDLYIADVGQGNWEEVNVAVSSGPGTAGRSANYGWNVLEGNHCYPPGTTTCNTAGKVKPLLEYDHSGGACSITGGYVYRGTAIPGLRGTYFYGDFCAGFVRSLRLVNGAATQLFDWSALRPGADITSFGEDGSGELYIMTSSGALYRIVPG